MENREFMPGDEVKIANIKDDGEGGNIGIVNSTPHAGRVEVELKNGEVKEIRLSELKRLDR